MGTEKLRQIIIPKEKAVFRMDANGDWHNEHGKFEHPKIIQYFNRSIRKDENGYYVHQKTDEFEEKVYFPYEDTAIFAVDLIQEDNKDLVIVLNTGQSVNFTGQVLFTENDNLYLEIPDHLVKFSQRALLKISSFLEEKNGRLFLCINGKDYPVNARK